MPPLIFSHGDYLNIPSGLRKSLEANGHKFKEKRFGEDEDVSYTLDFRLEHLLAMELTLLRLSRQTETPYEPLRQRISDAVQDVHEGGNSSERGSRRQADRLLIRDISRELVTEILYFPERYPGIGVRARHRRYYPVGEAAGLVTGYMIRLSEDRREKLRKEGLLLDASRPENMTEFHSAFAEKRALCLVSDAEIGARGIEASYDQELRGLYGLRVDVRDALNQVNRLRDDALDRIPEVPGDTIRTTLDRDLQERLYRELESQCRSMGNGIAASVVVMDLGERHPDGIPGSLLALCAYPDIDPNRARERGYFKSLQQDPFLARAKPQFKRPYQGVISPGSIFKLIVALAALEDGIEHLDGDQVRSHPLDPHEEFPCRKVFDERNPHFFRCTSSTAHGKADGKLDLSQALKHSCNTYFYYLGRDRVRARELAHWASLFGLGRPVKIDLDLPVSRQTRTTAGRLVRGGLNRREMLSYAIGHVHVGVSPMQVLRMVAGIALDGRVPWPFLVDARPPEVVTLRDPSNLAAIRQGMRRVFEEPGGTAHKTEYGLDAFTAGAKTGTAQIDRAGTAYNAWVVGYAPAENPSIAWVVSIEKTPHLGGTATAPITESILKYFGARDPRFYRSGRGPKIFESPDSDENENESFDDGLAPATFREEG